MHKKTKNTLCCWDFTCTYGWNQHGADLLNSTKLGIHPHFYTSVTKFVNCESMP